MEYKIFESSDTNVKKFVFEWRANERRESQRRFFIVMENILSEQ